MTRYLQRALAGEPASAADWNDHLVTFHTAFPNVTPGLIGAFRTSDGQTSYQRLAQHVFREEPSAKRIVDIGCGSGELMCELAILSTNDVELAGVDLVASELDIARGRVSGATLLCEDVAEVLPLRGFDVAVAHLSILSMARLRDALQNVHKALRPGGLASFVIEDFAPDSIMGMLAPAMRALHARYPALDFSTPSADGVENDVTLAALLELTGFTSVDITIMVLSAHLSVEEIADFALFSYPLALLDDGARAELRTVLRDSVSPPENANARILVKLPLKIISARTQNAISSDTLSTAMEYTQ